MSSQRRLTRPIYRCLILLALLISQAVSSDVTADVSGATANPGSVKIEWLRVLKVLGVAMAVTLITTLIAPLPIYMALWLCGCFKRHPRKHLQLFLATICLVGLAWVYSVHLSIDSHFMFLFYCPMNLQESLTQVWTVELWPQWGRDEWLLPRRVDGARARRRRRRQAWPNMALTPANLHAPFPWRFKDASASKNTTAVIFSLAIEIRTLTMKSAEI